jgi:hypothetical protein
LLGALAPLSWELQRAVRGVSRRFGVGAWLTLALLLAAVLAAGLQRHWQTQASLLQARLTERAGAQRHGAALSALPLVAPGPGAGPSAQGRARLQAFERHLLAHEDIPVVVQDLLSLAQDQGLVLQRGEYRPQIDRAGGFLRYRMSLPVKGPALAIQGFMQAALRAHPALALETIQFKRERIESTEIEARIQWVLLTRLPADVRALASVAGADAGGTP